MLTAHRVDHELISLDLKLIAAKGDEVATAVIAIQVSSTAHFQHFVRSTVSSLLSLIFALD